MSRTFLTISQGEHSPEDKEEAEAEAMKRKTALEEGPELGLCFLVTLAHGAQIKNGNISRRSYCTLRISMFKVLRPSLTYVHLFFFCTDPQKYYKPMLAGAETDSSIPKDLLKTMFSTIEILLPLNQEIFSSM